MIRVSRGMKRRRRQVDRMCTICNARGVWKRRIWKKGIESIPTGLLKDLDDQVSKVWEGEKNEDKRESRQKSIASTNSSSSFSLLLQNLSTQCRSLIFNESWESVVQGILNELIYSNLHTYLMFQRYLNILFVTESPLQHPCCGGVAWEVTKLLQPKMFKHFDGISDVDQISVVQAPTIYHLRS